MPIDFNQDIILENDRARLQPLAVSDWQILKEFSLKEPDLWKFSLLQANTIHKMRTYIAIAIKARSKGTSYPFIVIDKKSNQVAGSTRFYDYQSHHNTTQIGYTWFGKKFQGTGLNKHCKYLMLSYAFDEMGLNRVEFRADSKNARSIAAMESIGCTVEGILRSNCKSENGRRDSIILSILKEEWDDGLKTSLLNKLN